MAAFDATMQQDPTRMINIENAITELINEVHYIRTMQQQPISTPSPPSPPPPPPPVLHLNRPNLNLPTPPEFSGNPLELPTFKLKLYQFLIGNHNTYTDSASQLLYTGGLLSGSAYQWYQSMVDPSILQLPPTYTLDLFRILWISGDSRILRRRHHPSNSRALFGCPASDRHCIRTCHCFSEYHLFVHPSMA